nr:MAG TPA: hypothetical protein [Caudoviricetes sp.]
MAFLIFQKQKHQLRKFICNQDSAYLIPFSS